MASNTKHIAPSEWERHREVIIRLRRLGIILEGANGIMTTMEKDHGFIASSSQYELQLKKWEERKNLHRDEWRQVIQTIDQYNKNGIQCDVYKNGQLIPQRTLKRKRKEYCKGDEYAEHRQGQVMASSLPGFIEFRTYSQVNQAHEVGDFNVHGDLSHEICTITASFDETNTDETALQLTQVDRHEIVGNLGATTSPLSQEHITLADASLAKIHHNQLLGSPFTWTNHDTSAELFPIGFYSPNPMYEQFSIAQNGSGLEVDTCLSVAKLSEAAGGSIPYRCSTLERRPASQEAISLEPDISFGNIISFDFSDTWALRSPSLPFEESLQSQGNFNLNEDFTVYTQQPTHNRQKDLVSLNGTNKPGESPGNPLLTRERSIIVQSDPSASIDTITHAEILNSVLSSLLPPEALSSALNTGTTLPHPDFASSLHGSLIFSICNNFAGLESVPMGAVLKFLTKDAQMHSLLINYLRTSPKNVCRALVENLVRAAIEDCDATLVTALMSTGIVKPNEIVCLVEGQRHTAVGRSAMLRSTEVTQALLVAGADVNKTYSGREGRALELAIGKYWVTERIDTKLVNLLLEGGAEVRWELLSYAIRKRDPDLVEILMFKFSPSQRHEYLQSHRSRHGFIEEAIGSLDCELATMVVTQMLQACFETGCGKCPNSSPEFLASISRAAQRAFSGIVKLLLDFTPKKHLPLAAAVRSGQKDLIELLLNRGADVDAPASSMSAHGDMMHTPLAEAIRQGDIDLVRDFENRGALSNIQEGRRFIAAIYAAAEVKDVAYARKLLEKVPNIPAGFLDLALETSIDEGHEELALLLLRAGANVNADAKAMGRYRADTPSLIALRQKNEILVKAVMDCNMRVRNQSSDSPLLLAVRWGNLCVIKGLLSLGADVDEYGKTDDVQYKRVCTSDDNDDNDDDDGGGDRSYSRETAITAAVKGSNKLLVELLVKEHQASLNLFSDKKTSPLAAAISNKDINMFRYLLELGADPACHAAFRKAISKDREMLPELLHAFRAKHPAGKKGFGGVPLRIAIIRNDEQILDALLEAKLDVNAFVDVKTNRFNSLGTAITKHGRHSLKIIRKLMCAGSDFNGVVARICLADEAFISKTALLEAIATKSRGLVELLVEAGADTNRPAQLDIKRTPLQHACEVGSSEIVDFLLGRGVDVNEEAAFRGGGTSLQLCAIAGYVGIADKLLKRGADVHAARPEMKGRTALEGAAENGRFSMLKILWDATAGEGFDSEEVDRAMELAEGNGHIACRDFIQELRQVSQAFIMPESFEL